MILRTSVLELHGRRVFGSIAGSRTAILWLEDGEFKAMEEMAADPVCGMTVGREGAAHLRYGGLTYFFLLDSVPEGVRSRSRRVRRRARATAASARRGEVTAGEESTLASINRQVAGFSRMWVCHIVHSVEVRR